MHGHKMLRPDSRVILVKSSKFRGNIKFLLLSVLCLYSLFYLLLVNRIYITNLNQTTSINIKLRREGGQESPKPENEKQKREQSWKKLFFYDHPVLRRVEGKDMFYLSAIVDGNIRNLSGHYIKDTKTKIEHDTEDKVGPKNKNTEITINKQYDSDFWEYSNEEQYPDFPEADFPDTSVKTSTGTSLHGAVIFNGWETYRSHKERYTCCFEYKDKTKSKTKMLKKNVWDLTYLKIPNAVQVVCPLRSKETKNGTTIYEIPHRAALSSKKQNCQKDKKVKMKYVNVARKEVPPKRDKSIAVCAKVIYNNYPPDRLVEWFEFNKLMGVSKIMMYRYNVSIEAAIVLDYYEHEGLLMTTEFDYPLKKLYIRRPGGKNTVSFHDEQVAVFDCVERFHDYTFVAILDIDEFLVPSNAVTGTWTSMLNHLREEHTDAAGFSFHTQIFTLDWGISNKAGDLFVTKYIKRTSSMWDRKKNIFMPSRVQRGSVWTHEFTPVAPYTLQKITSQQAIIFHYRKCRRHWIMFNTCTENRRRIHDTTMITVMKRIRNKVKYVKKKLITDSGS